MKLRDILLFHTPELLDLLTEECLDQEVPMAFLPNENTLANTEEIKLDFKESIKWGTGFGTLGIEWG